ncbi:MAG: GNAT family N-acetyltransferase [Acidimicrobiales bacterium]
MPTQPALELRRATAADALAVAAVHVLSWQEAYRNIMPDEFLDAINVAERARRYTFDDQASGGPVTWMASESGTVRGLVTVSACRDQDVLRVGEIQALYVTPSKWRSGIGATLLSKGEQLLVDDGFAAARLWVLEQNARARDFYEVAGWRSDARTKIVEIGGRELVEIRYLKSLVSGSFQ